MSCHPSSGGATSSSPRRRVAIKNQTRMETVLRWGGGRGWGWWRVGGDLGGCGRVGGVSGPGSSGGW